MEKTKTIKVSEKEYKELVKALGELKKQRKVTFLKGIGEFTLGAIAGVRATLFLQKLRKKEKVKN